MSDLTRKQIEEARGLGRDRLTNSEWLQLCDMALRTLDAEARIRNLEAALRVADEALATATGIREGDRWRISNARKLIEALTTAPPDSEPAVPEAINVVFDGPPGPTAGRFVEVETDDGKSVRAGEWIERDDGLWALRIERALAQHREKNHEG